MIILIVFIVMGVLLLAAAIYAISHRDLLFAVMGTGIVSVILSLFFYILQAPDVALTEAAIGIALTTIIFIITIRNTTRDEDEIIDKENEKL
ncbi:MAG: DUF4040 domain-containing protein [Flavobacteriaceae bacterium]|nr:DUF4040 domain-containing protein [Flavobacteriaceae bacterium]